MRDRFDWPALMRAGMQGLGLKPAEFWALTPMELRLMLGECEGVRPMARDGLEALIDRKSFYRLVDLGQHRDGWFGVWSGGKFFGIIPSEDLP